MPEDVKPLAKEYMNALVDNLRQALMNAYDEYEEKLENLLQFADSRRDRAQSRLAKAMEQTKARPGPVIEPDPADVAVHELLEQIVDLPNLDPSTSFAAAAAHHASRLTFPSVRAVPPFLFAPVSS